MKQLKLFAIGLIACLAYGTTIAADTATEQVSSSQQVAETSQAGLPDRIVSPRNTFGATDGFDHRYLHKANMACGIPPIPPVGCKVGACVCDQNRQNCQWTFICN